MSSGGTTGPRGTGGTRAGGGAGGAGGAGVASSERQGDGSLTVTPDSPADAEWRARRGPLDGVGEITGPWGEEDSTGPQPTDLYGKFTWKIENFSEISKRELRSNVFEVGGMKWYILVYPQGCDVHNHLSLFLCVADYDKLLPGWSHFAQFTIAVVNKDPKKSKYSDTLHRFCKKEHDWGWKKFMELSKVLDGFTVADTLVIKAQVQVIHEKPARPFRCLEPQYRRELVRVYLTNVEGICRRFLEEKREALLKTREDAGRWEDMRLFLRSDEGIQQARDATEKADALLKGVVKRFFNEKEVTSTLVMDALYCGCRALDVGNMPHAEAAKLNAKPNRAVWLSVAQNKAATCGDLLAALERASGPAPFDLDEDETENGDEFGDAAERDERRLAELGRRTVEMFALHHLFITKVEVAFAEALAIKMQEALIAEEEDAERLALELDENKKSKKAKQKQRKKDKKDAEDFALAAKAAEEAEAAAIVQAIADAKAAEEKRIKDTARALREAEEQVEREKAAAETAKRVAAEKAAAFVLAQQKREAATAAAATKAAAERVAFEKAAAEQAANRKFVEECLAAEKAAAETAARAADSENGSGDDAEMLSATGSHEDEDEDLSQSSYRGDGMTSAPAGSVADGAPSRVLPAPRAHSRTAAAGAAQHAANAPESPSRMTEKGAENGHAYDDGVKHGKKATKAAAATAAAAAEANASPGKKQLPMPRAGELAGSRNGLSNSPNSNTGAGAASSPPAGWFAQNEGAKFVAGEGALSAVEATALRAHAARCEHALFEKTNEVARLRLELESARASVSSGGVEPGGTGHSPARALSGDRLDVLENAGAPLAPGAATRGPPPGMSGKREPQDGFDGFSVGPPPPPGPPPGEARRSLQAPPLPPGPPPAPSDLQVPPPPPRHPPPPGQARDDMIAPGSFAQAAGGPRPPPGTPPGHGMRQGLSGKAPGAYASHPSPGLEDDFQHLGMIADLLDDSPGGGFF